MSFFPIICTHHLNDIFSLITFCSSPTSPPVSPPPAVLPQDDYPPLPEGISEALRDFLLQCFKKEPLLRKSAQELLKHPWLKNPRNHLEKVRTHSSDIAFI